MPPESKLDKVLGSLMTAEMRALISEMRISLKEVEKLKRQMTQKLVSIKRARVVNGDLVLEFTDGITQNLGRIVAKDGKDGQFIEDARVEGGQLVVRTNDGKVIRAGRVQGVPGTNGEDYVLTDDDIFEIALVAEGKLRKQVDNALEAENLVAIINNGKAKLNASQITGLVDQARLDTRFSGIEQMIRTAVHRAAIRIKDDNGDIFATAHNIQFANAQLTKSGDDVVVTVTADGSATDHGTLAGLGDDDHTQYVLITTGTSAPTGTPVRVGALFVDTTNDNVYVAAGTTSSDWKQLNNASVDLSAYMQKANNLSDVTSASTARTNLGLGTAAIVNTGTSSGNVPVLDGSGKLSTSVLPNLAISEYQGDFTDLTAALADAGVQASQRGDWFTVQTSGGATYIVTTDSPTTGSHVTLLSTPTGAVSSVNGSTGVVVLDADDIDDTATTNKFATAAQLAKVDYLSVTQAVDLDDVESKANSALQAADVDDTPVNGATTVPISSNWAYDHENDTTAHGATGAVMGTTNSQTVTNKDLKSATNTFAEVTTTASSSTPTPTGGSRENELYVTALAVNATIAAPTGTPVNGNRLIIRILDNGTTRTLAYNSVFRAIGVTLPTATTANKTIYLGCIYNSTDSKWDVVAVAEEA